MDPKGQQDQNKEYIEWSEEAKKNIINVSIVNGDRGRKRT